MGEMIWVEVLSRHREVVARHRCSGAELRIGRAYDNDVVIDDPHTAPHHLRVHRREDGRLVAEDLGSANGLYRDGSRRRTALIVLDGETPLRIGHTHLRIRQADHAVAPERRMPRSARRRLTMVALTAGIIGLETLSLWLEDTVEPVPSHYLKPLLMLAGLAVIWTGFWTGVSRMFSNQARFERNLAIALGGLFAFSLYTRFGQFVAFAFSWPTLTDYDYVAMWSVLAVLCFLHWRLVAAQRHWLKAAVLLPLLVAAVTAQTVVTRENGANPSQQAYLHHLMPPAFHLAPLRSESTFFADVQQLKGEIDQDRAKEPFEPGTRADIRPTSE